MSMHQEIEDEVNLPPQNLNSKYQLTQYPALPARCSGCGKQENGRTYFMDLAFSVDEYGAVVLCLDCVKEMAVSIGFVPVAKVQEATDRMDSAIDAREELHTKLRVLEDVVFTYGIVVPVSDGDSDSTVDSDSSEEPGDSVSKSTESGLFK